LREISNAIIAGLVAKEAPVALSQMPLQDLKICILCCKPFAANF
jgi:hypothetical protein